MRSKKLLFFIFIIAVFLSLYGNVCAQDTIVKPDTANVKNDTAKTPGQNNSEYALSSKVDYKALDSVRINLDEKKVYLYNKAEIKYEDITLTADYVEISFGNNRLFANGVPDSAGKIVGEPVFKQGAESFNSENLSYNFKTRKGLISGIITKEGDSYIHGNIVKKFPDNSINIRNGLYTTCGDKDPHFEIKFAKARIIPDDKIITGPAYLMVEGVPTPLAVPFGYFPNKKGQKSGVLIPSYGESASRGFFLENGGYYLGLGEHFDLAIRGDIYSHGSWAAKAISNYIKKYKFSGNINLGYAINIEGEKGAPTYQKNKDFFIKWSHNQDAKARPNSRFSANVNAGSSRYNTYNPSSTQDYLSNTLQSNVSYSATLWRNCNFSANMRHSQNTITKAITMDLPQLAFSVNRFYPLRFERKVAKTKWYDNISVSYNMNAQNKINTFDSLLFKNDILKKMQNGMQHTLPVSWSGRVLKNFTWTNGFNFNERWYLQSIKKTWVSDTANISILKTDTVQGFKPAHDFNFSSSLSTRLYGMFQFKKGKIVAIRHVISPSVSFVFTPDFGNPFWGYYRYLVDQDKPAEKPVRYYSVFENGIYGAPPANKSGFVNMSISNNLEMKTRSKKDTVSGTRKVVLIDNFSVSGGYDIAKDSLNWSKISMSGRTKLFKNIDVTYASLWDPYITDSMGINKDTFEFAKNKRLLRLVNTDWAFNLNWNLRPKEKKKDIASPNASNEEIDMIKANRDMYIDFDEPWSLSLQYTLNLSNRFNITDKKMERKVIQTLAFNGDVSITDKWKVGFTSGYDFEQKDFSYTSVNIYRDLHCWELVFNWIPMGFRKSYNMTVRVKSAVLQDLKLTKKKDFRDY